MLLVLLNQIQPHSLNPAQEACKLFTYFNTVLLLLSFFLFFFFFEIRFHCTAQAGPEPVVTSAVLGLQVYIPHLATAFSLLVYFIIHHLDYETVIKVYD
jgi:hypothetical protein